jgi:hypothetical protein
MVRLFAVGKGAQTGHKSVSSLIERLAQKSVNSGGNRVLAEEMHKSETNSSPFCDRYLCPSRMAIANLTDVLAPDRTAAEDKRTV